ncbi:MAG TPA: L-fucose mutarotase [bacterium]|nr:L-fucose mutarotase [bacterium]
MLKGISPVVGPELLSALCRMGHGDEIVLADAHFPAESLGPPVIRMDGVGIDAILDGVMSLIVLDQYDEEAVVMMETVPGDTADPELEKGYSGIIQRHEKKSWPVTKIGRFAFYERAGNAFAVVVSGDVRKYANVILKKGVIIH